MNTVFALPAIRISVNGKRRNFWIFYSTQDATHSTHSTHLYMHFFAFILLYYAWFTVIRTSCVNFGPIFFEEIHPKWILPKHLWSYYHTWSRYKFEFILEDDFLWSYGAEREERDPEEHPIQSCPMIHNDDTRLRLIQFVTTYSAFHSKKDFWEGKDQN